MKLSPINILFPMAGTGQRFQVKGQPPRYKPFIQFHKLPLFAHAAESAIAHCEMPLLYFIVKQADINKFQVDQEILRHFPEAKIIILDIQFTRGALETAFLGSKNLDHNLPLLICDCDLIFLSREFKTFLLSEKSFFHAALLTFPSQESHFSYLALDDACNALYIKEKEVISSHAIAGAYYFPNTGLFQLYARQQIKDHNACTHGEYYIAPLYNELIKNKVLVNIFNLDQYTSLGSPLELSLAKATVAAKSGQRSIARR